MDFKKYQHVCRLGTQDTEGILNGCVYVQPKIDGCNTTAWLGVDGEVHLGSRNQEFKNGTKNDRGLIDYVARNTQIKQFLQDHPNMRLYMEYLVPHSLRTYKDDAWKIPYVFDVVIDTGSEVDDIKYLVPSVWQPLMEKYDIAYIPNLWVGNGSELTLDKIKELVNNNMWLIDETKGNYGEGIVIKNYNYKNKYGRIVWAKVLHDEFNNRGNSKKHCSTLEKINNEIECEIINDYCTSNFIEKEYAKIASEYPYLERKKVIPMLLSKVWYELINEEMWNIVKKYKNPVVNFRVLNKLCIDKVKQVKVDLFK